MSTLILHRSVIVFIDDILLYSKTKEQHEEHLREVLETLMRVRLYAKFSKCEFRFHEVHFLGQIVNQKSIVVNLDKIKVVMQWESLRTTYEVRSFLGLAQCYRIFIQDFCKKNPLTRLT